MHNAAKTLRFVLPIAFAAFLGVLIFSYTGRDEEAPAENAVESDDRSPVEEDFPQLIAVDFDDTHSIGGRVLSRIRAEKTVGFQSGWYTLAGVQLDIYRKDGSTYSISSPSARFHPETKEADASGGVRVFSNDGLSIATREVTFDGSSLRNRIPIEFKVDEWEGRAGGVDLDVETETLRLVGDVEATMDPPVASEPPMTVRAGEAVFDRETGQVSFLGRVELARGRELLMSDRLNAMFDQTREILLGLEGTGNVTIRLGSSSLADLARPSSGSGERVIHADRFTVETGPDGAIRAANVTSEGRSRAIMTGTVEREIEARKFRVRLGPSGVESMEATGDAVMVEKGPDVRTIRAGTFRLYFDPATGETTSAFLEDDFRYQDSKTRAEASNANYSIIDDRIVLTAEEGAAPTLLAEGLKIRSRIIEVAPERQVLNAHGQVVARIEQQSSSATSESSLFPASDVIFVNADSLFLEESEGRATFTGNVRAWQGRNAIFSDELQIVDEGGSISARGRVRTVLYNTSNADRKTPVGTSSDQLWWTRTENRLNLNGNVTIEDEGRAISSSKAVFVFNEASDLDRVEVDGEVELTEESTGRTGSASRAVYHVSDSRIVFEGDPASISDSQGTIRGAQIVFDVERNRVDVLRGEGQTEATFQPDSGGRIR